MVLLCASFGAAWRRGRCRSSQAETGSFGDTGDGCYWARPGYSGKRSASAATRARSVADVGAWTQRVGDDVGDLGELGVAEAAGGQRRRADAQAGGDHRRARVERDGVAVDGDADLVQPVLGLLAVQLGVAQVDQHQVDVGAAGAAPTMPGVLHVRLRQPLGEDLRAAQRRAAGGRLNSSASPAILNADGLGGDDVLERAALLTGEDGGVDLLGELRVVGQDEAPARAAEGLVRGRW